MGETDWSILRQQNNFHKLFLKKINWQLCEKKKKKSQNSHTKKVTLSDQWKKMTLSETSYKVGTLKEFRQEYKL